MLLLISGLVFLLLVCLCLSLVGYSYHKQSVFKRLGIPGPKPALFFGHLKDYFAQGMFGFDVSAGRKYGKIFGTFYGNCPALIIADADMIKEICIKHFSKFYDRAEPVKQQPLWKRSINNASGDLWKYLRTILQPAFTTAKMNSLRPVIDRCMDNFCEVLNRKRLDSPDGEVEVYQLFRSLTMDIICSAAFGLEIDTLRNEDDTFVKHASAVLGVTLGNKILMLNFLFPDLADWITYLAGGFIDKEAMTYLRTAVKKAMKNRREDSAHSFHDLLKSMMDTQKTQPVVAGKDTETFEELKARGMTDDEIIINGIIFLAAGHETTSLLLTWIVYCLATNKDCQDRLIEEIDREVGTENPSINKLMNMPYLEMVVCETLRLYSPALRFNRTAAEDITINGVFIPKGMDVTFSSHVVQRNPEYWPEPEKFDPERFSPENKKNIHPCSYIPFGVGPRNCVGMKLALVETKLTIVRLFQNVKIMPSPKLNLPLKVGKGSLVKPEGDVLMRVQPRA